MLFHAISPLRKINTRHSYSLMLFCFKCWWWFEYNNVCHYTFCIFCVIMSLNQKTHGNWNLNLVHGAKRIDCRWISARIKWLCFLCIWWRDDGCQENVGNIEIAKTNIMYFSILHKQILQHKQYWNRNEYIRF